MNEFSISQIRDTFIRDISELHKAAAHSLAQLAEEPTQLPALESLFRSAHSLKGLAGMVSAKALEELGRDCCTLCEIAHAFQEHKPEVAAAIFGDLSSLLPTWQQINIISVSDQPSVAEALYLASHRHLQRRWFSHDFPQKSLHRSSNAPGEEEPELETKPEPAPVIDSPGKTIQTVAPPSVTLPQLKKLNAPVARPFSFLEAKSSASVPAPPPPLPLSTLAALGEAQSTRQKELDDELLSALCEEALSHAETMEHAALLWEKGTERSEQIESIQRAAHTLKGAANSVGQNALGQRFHRLEDFFMNDVPTEVNPPKPLIAFFLRTVDALRLFVRDLAAHRATTWPEDWESQLSSLTDNLHRKEEIDFPAKTSPPAPNSLPSVDALDEAAQPFQVRLEVSRLEKLLNLIGETIIDRNRVISKMERLNQQFRTLRQREENLQEQIESFRKEFEFNLLNPSQSGKAARKKKAGPADSTDFSLLEFDRYDRFNIISRSLAEVANDIREVIQDMQETVAQLFSENDRFAQTSRSFQGELTSLALLPISVLLARLERAFFDAVALEGKQAKLVFLGAQTTVDKTVLDRLYPPLLHLIRNAVGHGIEPAEERERAGKNASGTVTVSARTQANRLFLEVSDDGRGIDEPAVRARALSLGWIEAGAAPLTVPEMFKLMCRPHFSTAKKLTELSGRGIGLDVVRNTVERLNGTLTLDYSPGKSTCWTMELPLSLSITESLVVEVGNQRYALPLLYIHSGILLNQPALLPDETQGLYQTDDFTCPAYRLADLLGLPGKSDAEQKHSILVQAGQERALFLVDRLIGRSEIAVKDLGHLLSRHPLLSGATLDPEGGVVPILNLPSLIQGAEKIAQRQAVTPAPVAAKNRTRLILVVDDSLSVRKAQQQIFTELGYQTLTAIDGEDALEKIRQAEVDLIFTDLEMPRLHGYELIAEIRANPKMNAVPIVVVSSRSTEKYVNRALALGAETFVPKPFTRDLILPLLQRYLPEL